MRSLFLIVLLNFLFFYCAHIFAQSISCWKGIGGYSCSDGTHVDKTLGGFSIYKSDINTMSEDSRESLRRYLCSRRSPEEVCLREAAKREAKRSGITTKPA